ncbi:MAG: FAD synthase [Candidatus Altiarchaeota archaeon]|nr:FAD synthase [Candidatus Altiarchaeota archaeon]
MVRVLATGVFDIIHPGHIFFLAAAKALGDELIVIVSRDRIAQKIKKKPIIPEKQRVEVVRALKPVDNALLGDSEDIFKLIPLVNPDIIALGFDQDVDEAWLESELERLNILAKIVRIKRRLEGDFFSTSSIVCKIKDKKGAKR